jgi:hypothetical protein
MKLIIYIYIYGKKIHSTKVIKMILVDHILNIAISDSILLIKILNTMNMSHKEMWEFHMSPSR